MKKYKVIAIVQIYNELRKENLERFIKHILPLVDALVVYDDASTDGSYEYVKRYTPHVIKGKKNDFTNERAHRQQLLEAALKLKPDFILWLDADEVLTAGTKEKLQEITRECIEKDLDGISLHEINLWRSSSWQRIDNLYNDGWFVRLWRVTPQLAYTSTQRGLHQQMHPDTIKKIEKTDKLSVIHYGFASDKSIAHKYLTYKKHGQTGSLLLRLIDERTLELTPVNPSLFPTNLYQQDQKPLVRLLHE
ncbi:MAG TPA: glycosyltransferase, partial [Chryseolinea sp.]|nr:glycosyltransferase [Chryseolinea sp.]